MTYMIRGLDPEPFALPVGLDDAKAGEAHGMIRDLLFADDAIAYSDAYNAAHGCFAARIERDAAQRSGK